MCALKVLSLIWTNPKKGLKHKRVLQRDAFEGETYYEAIPTTAILTTLVLSTFFASIFQLDSDNENDSPLESVIGSDVSDVPFFLATFASSVLTTTLGLSKALKTGPCKIFPGTSLFTEDFSSLPVSISSICLGNCTLRYTAVWSS